MTSCVMCAGADPARRTPLDELVPEGLCRFVAQTDDFAAVPTFGCFLPGYLLVLPRRHALSFGELAPDQLDQAHELVDRLAGRLQDVYRSPVLGFEYGLSAPGIRRVEHAHWHLLPTPADLASWLDVRLAGQPLRYLTDLPGDRSYIAVRSQDGVLRRYDVGHDFEQARQMHGLLRLRRAVAALDPRVPQEAWDFAEHRFDDQVIATLTALAMPVHKGAPV
jgi:diadenosine tetraphosphate (Ap4A) HIT family hydrolase